MYGQRKKREALRAGRGILAVMQSDITSGARAAFRTRPARVTLALVLVNAIRALAADAGESVPAPFEAGRYRLASQLLMPHLDEMRRTSSASEACLAPLAPEALFPVFAQYALGGCRLGYPKDSGDSVDYVLVCASARVASGTARLVRSDAGVVGTLAVKMGGKNMTFSQRVVAERVGDCTAQEAAAGLPAR